MAQAKKFDRSIGALGSRWGLQSEEAFRNALAGILEENFHVQVLNIMRVRLDQGLPRSAVFHLNATGCDAIHLGDIGMSRATDRENLRCAEKDNRA
jgi:hypothetical protein